MEAEYEYIEGYDHSNSYSDNIVFDIDPLEKKITKLKGQTLVAGECNSQYIAFTIPRYVDGIDLSTKSIQVLYIAAEGHSDINKVINAARSEDTLRFGWVVPGEALTDPGVLTFAIEFAANKYMLKIRSIEQEIVDGLDGSAISPEPTEQAWYIEIQQRCQDILDDVDEVNKNAIVKLQDEVAELKKSGRDGREDLASAITEKGIGTDAGEDMHEMADHVRQIPTGTEYRIGLTELTTSLCQSDEYVLPLCSLNCVAFHEKIKGTGGSLIL